MPAPDVEIEHRADGSMVLRSRAALDEAPHTIFEWLDRWAKIRPDRAFVTEPVPDAGRRVLTYADARREVERRAAHLVRRGVATGERVFLAARNSISHLLWGLAIMRAGAIYVPMAPQYVGPGHDRVKLRGLLTLLSPALVVCPTGPATSAVPSPWPATTLDALDDEVKDVPATAGPCPPVPDRDAVAKILLTSGSTGLPKPVPYSHRQMTTAMTMTLQVWPFAVADPPVLLDWLPWNHAFGGTANLHLVLACGGTLHIDAGGPTRAGLDTTLADVARVRPNLFFAVPAALDLLRVRLESDPECAAGFFSTIRMIFSAGAALSADTFHALRSLAEASNNPVVILSGWGSTETGPGATTLHIAGGGPGWIGTPLPGVEIKLSPEGGKHHASVRGPNVFAGYWGAADPGAAFDEEGYYRTGDAVRLVDPGRPELGLRFDGRLADDFKLANGTWVDYARVRAELLALFDGHVADLVIGLPDGPRLAGLAWTANGEPLPDPLVADVLDRYNARATRPSDRVHALGTFATPPSPQEISPKGQLRPAEVHRSRRAEFDVLFDTMMKRTSR